ncbi:MAG: hypothetical protein AB7O59_19005 [Pirellulales bacterium]
MNAATRSQRRMRLVMLVMALAILLPSLYGFGTKFLEFVALYRGDVEGAFAISPIVNYLLASLGFLCLFGWAAMHGMFRDVEAPKQTLLDNEEQLDRTAPWRRTIATLDSAGIPLRKTQPAESIHHNRIRNFYEYDE